MSSDASRIHRLQTRPDTRQVGQELSKDAPVFHVFKGQAVEVLDPVTFR
ncbi:hypothetical protein [Sphingomonas sp. PAMC 26621]|nr:hypothetical protein [Sphingomonas sp. PAMC 26621]